MIRQLARIAALALTLAIAGGVLGYAGGTWCVSASAAPISAQPPFSTPTTGYVDPTVPTANSGHPLVACRSGCSTALVNQNTDALQWAVGQAAAAPHPWISLPPGEYPYARGGVGHNQIYGVHISGVSYITFRGYGATLRQTGDLGGSDFHGFRVDGGSAHVRFYGMHFSQRDMTHAPTVEQTHNLELGDGDGADDIQVIDCVFDEGYGGDGLRMLGGNDETLGVISRITITRTRFDSARDGLSFQHGSTELNNYGNYYGPVRTLPIHHEPTSTGGNNYENHVGNIIFSTSGADSLSLGGAGAAQDDGVHDSAFAWNVIPNGYFFMTLTTRRYWFVHNVVTSSDVLGNLVLSIEDIGDDIWVDDNHFTQNGGAPQGVTRTLWRNNQAPRGLWFTNNRIRNFSCTSVTDCGASLSALGTLPLWVMGNLSTYNSSAAPIGSLGGIGFANQSYSDLWGTGAAVHAVGGGWFLDNEVRADLQADGVTPAASMVIGIAVQRGSTGQFQGTGHTVIRGNVIGGASQAYSTQQGASLPDGPPLITQNRLLSVAAENLPASYVVETTAQSETLAAAGALSPSKRVHYLSAQSCGSDAFTLADGVRDGESATIEAYRTCDTTQTVTPTHFGDGTSISWSLTSGGPTANASIAWDAGGGKWWLLDKGSNVTVNP